MEPQTHKITGGRRTPELAHRPTGQGSGSALLRFWTDDRTTRERNVLWRYLVVPTGTITALTLGTLAATVGAITTNGALAMALGAVAGILGLTLPAVALQRHVRHRLRASTDVSDASRPLRPPTEGTRGPPVETRRTDDPIMDAEDRLAPRGGALARRHGDPFTALQTPQRAGILPTIRFWHHRELQRSQLPAGIRTRLRRAFWATWFVLLGCAAGGWMLAGPAGLAIAMAMGGWGWYFAALGNIERELRATLPAARQLDFDHETQPPSDDGR